MKKIFIVLLLFFFSLEFVKGQTSKLGYEVSDSTGVLELVKWERKDSIVRQFNIEVQFVKSVNYTFEQSL